MKYYRAPSDCFQYHTGIFGNIQSFNFANGQMLSSQAYKICFRQELDFCTISFTASLDTTPDPWELLTGNSGTISTVANCKTTFVGIPDGGDTGHMDSRAQRYCGSYFDSSEGSTRNGQVSCESHQSSVLSQSLLSLNILSSRHCSFRCFRVLRHQSSHGRQVISHR